MVATLRVLIPAVITNAALTGTNLNFSFSTVSGLNYTIEYKNKLSDPSWTVLRTLTGNSSAFNLSDPVAAPTRFYRVQVD